MTTTETSADAARASQPGPDQFPDRADDGLFGPSSVSWRLFADPSAQLGMVCAVMLQALNPGMMRLFDEASINGSDPVGRAERTGRFVMTTIFGDTAHAEGAGETVRRIHQHVRWTDPRTGTELKADEPAWLEWTHNSIVWGVLAGYSRLGPGLSDADADTFVHEQHRAAELVGIDASTLASTRAALDDYVQAQSEWLALTLPAAVAVGGIRQHDTGGSRLESRITRLAINGALWLLPPWARQLYGLDDSLSNKLAFRSTVAMLALGRRSTSYERLLHKALGDVQDHPYRRIRRR